MSPSILFNISCQFCFFCSLEDLLQAMISSTVLKQPLHQLVSSSIVQIDRQGEVTTSWLFKANLERACSKEGIRFSVGGFDINGLYSVKRIKFYESLELFDKASIINPFNKSLYSSLSSSGIKIFSTHNKIYYWL